MADPREEILARIAAALGDRPAPPPVDRSYQRAGDGQDPVALFVERVSDYRATVEVVTEAGVAEAVTRALSARGAATADPGVRRPCALHARTAPGRPPRPGRTR